MVSEAEGAAQGIFDEVFGEAAGDVFFTGCDEGAHFMGAGKLGAFVEGARGIDLPGFSLFSVPATFVFGALAVCRAPLAGGVEVFELGEVVEEAVVSRDTIIAPIFGD